MTSHSSAEGIVDFKPHVSATVDYDDNVFRLSSPEQAKALIGTDKTSDVVKSLELGLAVNLRLSRQLVVATASVTENKYSRFKNLDNTGNDIALRWDWHLGSNMYGELGVDRSEAAAGFNEARAPVKDLRTVNRQFASVNWELLPDWTLHANGEEAKLANALASSKNNDRQDNIYEAGILYHNRLDTQLGLAYRVADSSFPNRQASLVYALGNSSSQKEVVVTAGWLPSAKIKLSTRLSKVNLTRSNSSLSDLSGFSQHWDLVYTPTYKINFKVDAYRDVSPEDDAVTTYVKATGFEFDPTWNLTSKLSIRGNASYSERTYLGSANLSISNNERVDKSKLAGISLIYAPTLKSLLQVGYQGEKRTSNIENIGYRYNNFSFTFRYDF